ncbi:hypothetical protein [uncultured Bdellovibrio sp.]|uniref:hypothetical protein n=1 Tax=Bdellovibrio sp. HCB-162 TaxID=3394234 RepID=UPI0025FACC40|nr:hypothetical protein [uncultured Bdellovibrio sp.]
MSNSVLKYLSESWLSMASQARVNLNNLVEFKYTDVYLEIEDKMSELTATKIFDSIQSANVVTVHEGPIDYLPSVGTVLVWEGSSENRMGLVTEVNEDRETVKIYWGHEFDEAANLQEQEFTLSPGVADGVNYFNLNEPEGGFSFYGAIFPVGQLSTNLRVVNWICNMDKNKGTRTSSSYQAYPLNLSETAAGAPRRNLFSSVEEKLAKLDEIIRYLDVANSARYTPTGNTTFCNVYGFDYCYLAGVYFPRVWWIDAARNAAKNKEVADQLLGGKLLKAQLSYSSGGTDVWLEARELRANDIYNWFTTYSHLFGWRTVYVGDPNDANESANRYASAKELQEAANSGKVCAIITQRRDVNRSGHVSLVVPETSTHQHEEANGVYKPVQSMAGEASYLAQYTTKIDWWPGAANNPNGRIGFFIHD